MTGNQQNAAKCYRFAHADKSIRDKAHPAPASHRPEMHNSRARQDLPHREKMVFGQIQQQ
jgi:hypothetical protein